VYGERLRSVWRETLEAELERGASWPDLEMKLQQLAQSAGAGNAP